MNNFTGTENWIDLIFKKWFESGNESSVFLIVVCLVVMALISAIVGLFWLLYREKDARIKDKEGAEGKYYDREKYWLDRQDERDGQRDKDVEAAREIQRLAARYMETQTEALKALKTEITDIKSYIKGE